MIYVGNIREFGPGIRDIPPGPRSKETKDLLRRGQLYWAGEEYLRQGLYMWTGSIYVLIESSHNILVKMEAGVGNEVGPMLKADFNPPKPHKEKKE